MKKYIKPSMRVKAIYEKEDLMNGKLYRAEFNIGSTTTENVITGDGPDNASIPVVTNDIKDPNSVGAKPHSVWDPEDLDEE